MDKIKNPVGRIFIYIGLIIFAIYSILPFYWTAAQSFKTLKDANSRTPKFIFTPTWENYQELWLRSAPDNGATIAFFLIATFVILICLLLFAEHIPVNNNVIYALVGIGFIAWLWAIPQLVDTNEFFDYFINTIIVTTGTIVISISIGSLAGYSLARYSGMAGVIVLIAALAFRSLPRLAFILPYFWIGTITNLIDSYLLVILTLVAVNQPFYDSDFVKYFNNKQATRPGQNHGQLISGRVLARSMNIYFSEKRSPQV